MSGSIGKAVRAVAEAVEQRRLRLFLFAIARKLTAIFTICWVAGLVLIWLTLRFVGELNITTAFLMYLPQTLWLLPAVPLMILSAFFHRGCLAMIALAAALAVWLWMGFEWRPFKTAIKESETQSLSLMTYNRGQHMNQSLRPFKDATRPDLLLLQDASNRAAGYLTSPEYAEFKHGKSIGEHTLLSRYPILEATLLEAHPAGNKVKNARFVIEWNSSFVSIYSVHLATPRHVLTSYKRGAFLWGILGMPGTPWQAKRRAYQVFWDQHMTDVRSLLEDVKQDTNPALVAGDFNAPHIGYVYRLITSQLGDAHVEAGSEFGFTFPGTTHNPLSFGGPWMRIDYILHNEKWRALDCVTEPRRPSQHRALFAKFSPRSE